MSIFLVIAGIIGVLILFNTVSGSFGTRGITMIDVSEAQSMVKDSNVTIIDVRTPQEYKQGHLKKAQLIPVSEIGNRIGEIEALKDSPVLVYCRSGHRSSMAARMLRKAGFSNISNLQGGITSWQGAGGAVTKK